MSQPKEFKVKRISQGCCGMVKGQIYDARWSSVGTYIFILVNGEWTTPHWFGECFEVLDESA